MDLVPKDVKVRQVTGTLFRFPSMGEARKISSPPRPPLAIIHEVEVVQGLQTLLKHQT